MNSLDTAMASGAHVGSIAEWAMVSVTFVSVVVAVMLIRPALISAKASQDQLIEAKRREDEAQVSARVERSSRLVVWWAHDHDVQASQKPMILVIDNATGGVVEQLTVDWSSGTVGRGVYEMPVVPPGQWRIAYRSKKQFDYPEPRRRSDDLRPHSAMKWHVDKWCWEDGDPTTYLLRRPASAVKLVPFPPA